MPQQCLTQLTLAECQCRDPGRAPTGDRNSPIPGGPLYRYSAIHELARLKRWAVDTRGTQRTFDNLQWESDHIRDFLLALSERTHRKSEWARNGAGIWIPCDVHKPLYNEHSGRVVNDGEIFTKALYAKFGVSEIGWIHLELCDIK